MSTARHRWGLRLLVVVAIAGLAWVLRATVLAPEALRVETLRAERGTVIATLTNTKAGTVEARRRARLSPGTSGIVVELCVERGERVRAGQVLLRLEDSAQRAALAEAEGALRVAEAARARAGIAARRAARALERHRSLPADAVVSRDLLDELESADELRRAEVDEAAARIELSRARVAVARAELEKTELRAPFDAVVAEVPVELGEWATPSIPLLAAPESVDLIDSSSLYVSAPMDEVDARRLAVGQAARVTLDPWPDQRFPGRVVRIAPYVLDLERQNRTIEVEVELDDADLAAQLLPGTSADVEVVLAVREDVLRLPAAALLAGDRVLLVEDGRLRERAIAVGLRNWDWVEVTGGLGAGEPVVAQLDRPAVKAGARATEAGDAGGPAP